MFGGTKPTFGQTSTSTGFGFNNTTTASPFSQSTFGKPVTGGFGQAATFGQQQNNSLFGGAQQPSTGLFGASTSSTFGTTTTAQPTFGGFSQPQQNTSIFGAAQPAAPQASLFGQSSTSAFGAAKPSGFGFGQTAPQPNTSLFGQSQPTSTAGFGSFSQTQQPTNAFASAVTAFGQPTASAGNATGSVLVKYQPTIGTDTLMKAGTPNNVNTKQHCITAMKEYEAKSLEELRMEDYLANRKGPQAGTSGGFSGFGAAQPAANTGGLFGASNQQTTGLFGQQTAQQPTENKNLFGTSIFGQPAPAFGATTQPTNSFLAKPFSTPATSTAGFAFGSATADNSATPFGAKTFGQTQTPSLFGQPSAPNTAAPAFGQANQTGFGGFGAPAQQTSVFGAPAADNKPSFGMAASTANTGFSGFGTNVNTSAAGGGLFAQKPAPAFGAGASAFGTSAANTGFGSFQANQAGSLFNTGLNKPPTTGFGGFGTQTSAAPLTFNTGQPSMFGNNANKPLFGNNIQPAVQGGGLFGGGTSMFGNNNTMGAFGASTLGGNTALGGTLQQNTIPIHQQILSKVTSPYGDNPIFKDLKRNDETDALRATNPLAQKAMLESSNSQFKISAKPSSNSIKIKPIGSALTKKALFEGLEEFDSSVETFSLKPNAKRLVIKPKQANDRTPNASLNSGGTPQSGKSSINAVVGSGARGSGASVTSATHRNESFSGEILQENIPPTTKEGDSSRRESWLHHPNNLEKVRQQNVHHQSESLLNNTLSELVPRKSSEMPLNSSEEATSVSRKDSLSKTVSYTETISESFVSNRSYIEDRNDDSTYMTMEPHPTGIVLRRVGYYTIPSLDDLKSYLSEDGSCIVPNFTIGREGYGNVYFNKEMDVAGLNLDEIVHFRNKEVIIYPDDDNKPPIGSGLNREAQITLDKVWPHDKTKHEPIKNPQRLAEMDYESKLRRVCDKNDIRFIEYRPETGSWVFKAKHFSKYGINESDEEDDIPTDPKKAKMNNKDGDPAAAKGVKIGEKLVGAVGGVATAKQDPKAAAVNIDEAEFMLMDKTQFLQNSGHAEYSDNSRRSALTSPTAVLAKGIGTDSHKLQLMKASLFIDDDMDSKSNAPEEKDDCENIDNNLGSRLFLTRTFDQYSSFWKGGYSNSAASSQVDYPGSQSPTYESIRDIPREIEHAAPPVETEPLVKYQPLIIKPKVAQVKAMASQVPFEKSLAFRLQGKCAADLGILNSRRFRVAFGPQNTLILPATKNSAIRKIQNANLLDLKDIFAGRQANDYSPTVLYQLKISSARHIDNFDGSIVDHLKIQLKNSLQVEVEGTDCPMIKSNGGTELIVQHLDEAIKQLNSGPLEEYAVSVWSLCLALWGEHDELEGSEADSHLAVMCRRNLMSQWLENTLTEKDLLTKNISKNTYIDHLMDLLMCHKVVDACELAFRYDDANLALLLSQLSSGPVVRQLMEDQLAAWHNIEADKFISVERLKLFMLVAGVALMDSSHGAVNTLEGIEWIKVLALQLWYLCSPTCSITDALMAYDKSFKADEFYAMPPSPYYVESAESSEKHPLHDLRYHILQLYSKRSHPLESLLNPLNYTADSMDYRISWLLLQTFEALGYHHCSEQYASQLHVDFASQLENFGLWQWSVFALLHIGEKNIREMHIQDYLYRYISVSNEGAITENEKFIINVLGVPEKWLDCAKAVKAGATGNFHMQAKYLLKAHEWAQAHEVIFEHIAPDAVINDNMDYLHDLLCQFDNPSLNKSIKVPNWSNQGQIFLDFIDINEKFKSLKNLHEGDIEARWENLKPQLADLCSRINLLPCPTPKHRLCQSEIAQSLACLVRGVLVVCPVLNPCLIIKIALERLPLPQEFAQQELRALLDTLVDDLCKSNEQIDVK